MGSTSRTHRSLKAAEELGEEGVVAGQGQDPLLCHGALHIVILQDHILLQDLHSIQLSCFLYSGQHHLPEAPLPQHPEELKVVDAESAGRMNTDPISFFGALLSLPS